MEASSSDNDAFSTFQARSLRVREDLRARPVSDDEIVPDEEPAIRAWLVAQGFTPGDLRSQKPFCSFFLGTMCPMARACFKGQLNVCKWLYENGAAEDITKENQINMHDSLAMMGMACSSIHPIWTPFLFACKNGQLPVCRWLLEVGSSEMITKPNDEGRTPMHYACHHGHLSLCEWLFEVGANEDISATNEHGFTPMHSACNEGHLPICEWLFEVSADEDIVTKVSTAGHTPMCLACRGGHLPVCEWLMEVGAGEDILKEDHAGNTPMYNAFMECELRVCRWLVLNGALNRVVASSSSAAADDDDDAGNDEPRGEGTEHVDKELVRWATRSNKRHLERDADGVLKFTYRTHRRVVLRDWARDLARDGAAFLHVVLHASASMPQRRVSPRRRCYLPLLPQWALELIRPFLGVESERRLHNASEFAEAMEEVLEGGEGEGGGGAGGVGGGDHDEGDEGDY